MTCADREPTDTFERKVIDFLVTVGSKVVLIPIEADVCRAGGNQVIDGPAADRLQAACVRLEAGDTANMDRVGLSNEIDRCAQVSRFMYSTGGVR